MNTIPCKLLGPLLLAALAIGCVAPGHERARNARDGLSAAHGRLADARAAAETARDALDALLATSGAELGPGYDAYVESVLALRRQAEGVARLPDQLRSRGDDYFDRWEDDLTRIQDPALRAASASRRGEALAAYNRVVGTMWTGQTSFDGLLSLLADVRIVLGNDLTPAGLDSVRETSGRVAEETAVVGKRLDALMAEIEAVSEAMSSSVPAR